MYQRSSILNEFEIGTGAMRAPQNPTHDIAFTHSKLRLIADARNMRQCNVKLPAVTKTLSCPTTVS